MVTLAELAGWCETHERVLRWQYEGGALPVAWEAELASVPADTAERAVQRLALLKHFYRVEHERREAKYAPPEPEEARAAAYALLRRTPVPVTLASGRTVEVTGRSVSCMTEIAAHQLRIRLLDAEIEALAAIASRLGRRRRSWWMRSGRRTRRLLRQASDLYRRAYTERELHRAQMYAHIFTPSGAPATSEGPPSWWREIAPEDDSAIMAALIEAGPLRYRRMGEPPRRKERKGERGADWGFEGLLVSWGIRKKVEPARMLDQDLGQALAEMRVSAPPSLEEEIDGD